MSGRVLVFVGSLTRNTPFFGPARGDGIHVFVFDGDKGALQPLSVTTGADNPNYIAFDPEQNVLYAASEVFEWHEGIVTSYALDPLSGGLTYINKQPTLGHLSAFVSLDRRRRHLLVSNYSMQPAATRPGKALVVLPLDAGTIKPASDSVVRAGTGPNAERQERSHAHCLVETPEGRLVAADLGTDEVAFYNFDAEAGRMSEEPVEVIAMPPGSGPRHLVCSKDGARIYVLNEMAQTVTLLTRPGEGRSYEIAQSVSTLPEGADTSGTSAGIVLSPDGRFLFASNRGHDSIMAFRIDPGSGRLTQIGACASGGRTPRTFAIDPSGGFLIVANQEGHNLTILQIDQATGALADNQTSIELSSPMCVSVALLP
ncbi:MULTISPECIES: lactonase family protein [unclassified Acidisoma]|uniref:lactonase family protein n=1 Tax=unclassified Acidisoma TaxID=2634065 RepID=UPI00131D587A|nr:MULTISPECIES: lactonase family protein [unclassified Acidisoma]